MFERFSAEARDAVTAAVGAAQQLGSTEVGPEHLLIGLADAGEPTLIAAGLTRDRLLDALRAQNSDSVDADALSAVGIDLEAIRAAVDAQLGAGAWDAAAPGRGGRRERGMLGRLLPARRPFTSAGRKVLELGLRETIAENGSGISGTHLLRGLLRAPGPTATAMIQTKLSLAELRALATAARPAA